MTETIRSYIDKNLTSLNWNILPQIFESEGVELTEEIERYLRETPKNTNWNVFGSLGKNSNVLLKRMVSIRGVNPEALGTTIYDTDDDKSIRTLFYQVNDRDVLKFTIGEYSFIGTAMLEKDSYDIFFYQMDIDEANVYISFSGEKYNGGYEPIQEGSLSISFPGDATQIIEDYLTIEKI